jgi:hypothetical protein
MTGYVPPWVMLPMCKRWSTWDPLPFPPPAHQLDLSRVAWSPCNDGVASPIVVMSDLIRWHGVRHGITSLTHVDPFLLRRFIHGKLAIEEDRWPLSLSAVGACIRSDDPGDGRGRGVQPGDAEGGLPGVEAADQGDGIRLVPFGLPAVPHTVKWCIHLDMPVAAGIVRPDSADDPGCYVRGEIRRPLPGEVTTDGVCVVICGWDDTRGSFRVRGSEGPEWGQDGYGWMPYEFIETFGLTKELVGLMSE